MSEPALLNDGKARDGVASPERWWVLAAVVAALLAIFVGRTALAREGYAPRLPDLFHTLIVAGSAFVLLRGYRSLRRTDWLAAAGLGMLLGFQLPYATLFQPYPYLDLVRDAWSEGLLRAVFTSVAALGGLAVMRRGGPVYLGLGDGAWLRALVSFGFGAVVGIPLAALNAFANAWTQGRPWQWQSPLAAALDALQPAVFEEVVYRLALLGLIWFVLRRVWPTRQAAWLAGLISLLVHAYGGHFSDEFITRPLATLVMGGAMGLIWGLPLTVLALRRDLDSAIGFHWMLDFARFWAGF